MYPLFQHDLSNLTPTQIPLNSPLHFSHCTAHNCTKFPFQHEKNLHGFCNLSSYESRHCVSHVHTTMTMGSFKIPYTIVYYICICIVCLYLSVVCRLAFVVDLSLSWFQFRLKCIRVAYGYGWEIEPGSRGSIRFDKANQTPTPTQPPSTVVLDARAVRAVCGSIRCSNFSIFFSFFVSICW